MKLYTVLIAMVMPVVLTLEQMADQPTIEQVKHLFELEKVIGEAAENFETMANFKEEAVQACALQFSAEPVAEECFFKCLLEKQGDWTDGVPTGNMLRIKEFGEYFASKGNAIPEEHHQSGIKLKQCFDIQEQDACNKVYNVYKCILYNHIGLQTYRPSEDE